jgi:hypothetical protein
MARRALKATENLFRQDLQDFMDFDDETLGSLEIPAERGCQCKALGLMGTPKAQK